MSRALSISGRGEAPRPISRSQASLERRLEQARERVLALGVTPPVLELLEARLGQMADRVADLVLEAAQLKQLQKAASELGEDPEAIERHAEGRVTAIIDELAEALSSASTLGGWAEVWPDWAEKERAEYRQRAEQMLAELLAPLAARRLAEDVALGDVFREGLVSIPTNHPAWAFQRAIHDAHRGLWTDHDGHTVPTHKTLTNKGREAMYVSLRRSGSVGHPTAEELRDLWGRVRALDDLTSDVLLVCLAHLVRAGGGPDKTIWITAEAILDGRNRKRMGPRPGEPGNWQHGHRREDRLKVARALAQLEDLWIQLVNVTVIHERWQRKARQLSFDSRALVIRSAVQQSDLEGDAMFLAARVMLGEWAAAYWDLGVYQVGLMAQHALSYDPYRQQWEKRLAKYLAFHLRFDARRREPLRRRVDTLIEGIGFDCDIERPMRTRERLEKALARLLADGVIAAWRYEPTGALPARGWATKWLGWVVAIEPPAAVAGHYLKSTAPVAAALPGRA